MLDRFYHLCRDHPGKNREGSFYFPEIIPFSCHRHTGCPGIYVAAVLFDGIIRPRKQQFGSVINLRFRGQFRSVIDLILNFRNCVLRYLSWFDLKGCYKRPGIIAYTFRNDRCLPCIDIVFIAKGIILTRNQLFIMKPHGHHRLDLLPRICLLFYRFHDCIRNIYWKDFKLHGSGAPIISGAFQNHIRSACIYIVLITNQVVLTVFQCFFAVLDYRRRHFRCPIIWQSSNLFYLYP